MCQGTLRALRCPHLEKKWGTKRGWEKMGAGEEERGACGILLSVGWGMAPIQRVAGPPAAWLMAHLAARAVVKD